MTTPTEPLRKATARDLFFFGHPEHWPTGPFLPVVRRHAEGTMDYGVLYDTLHATGRCARHAADFAAGHLDLVPNAKLANSVPQTSACGAGLPLSHLVLIFSLRNVHILFSHRYFIC